MTLIGAGLSIERTS